MVTARELGIAGGDIPHYWEWLCHLDSRFSEVAKLNLLICWLDIRCKIETRILSKRTKYFANLVFKLEDGCYDHGSAIAVVKFVDSESGHDAEQRAKVVYSSSRGSRVTIPTKRGDGWMELKMGYFFRYTGEDGDVEAWLTEIRRLEGKPGRIVQGIEFRPE